jgi:threonine dehydrogenase-like Zn-dependent dehydrogenase
VRHLRHRPARVPGRADLHPGRGAPPADRGLAERLIDVGFYITKRIPLDDLVTSGFQELIQNKNEHVKILVQP